MSAEPHITAAGRELDALIDDLIRYARNAARDGGEETEDSVLRAKTALLEAAARNARLPIVRDGGARPGVGVSLFSAVAAAGAAAAALAGFALGRRFPRARAAPRSRSAP